MKTIKEGSTAPDFELPDENGNPIRLSERLKDGPVVLFFYPGALTGGCTQEACRFRDLSAEFKALGAQPLGISADTVAKQKEFSEVNTFDYPLLSDEDREVATAYGVKRKYVTPVKRATFVIDEDQTIKRVIATEMKMEIHADEALAALK
ncbi:MAG: peroxiredoxin [Nocardioides sp.]